MTIPKIRDTALIEYLEDVLTRAKAGDVLFFVGSAGVIAGTPSEPFTVLVGVTQAAQAQLLDAETLRAGFIAVTSGLARAAAMLQSGVERELAGRGEKAS